MWVLFLSIIDVLFPKSDDELLLQQVSRETFLKKYNPTLKHEVVRLASIRDAEVKAAIHLNKFHNHAHARRLLGALLETYLVNQVHQDCIIIPIPLSKARLRSRGYNQVTTVISTASFQENCRVVTDILLRNKNTKPQTSLSKAARTQNLKNVFCVPNRRSAEINNMHILLIDDVVTTGTTLKEARSVLQTCKPKSITCIALCG